MENDLLRDIPNLPGCYLMQNSSGDIIYVGKAKNLKKRVSSYFRDNCSLPKTKALVKNIYRISTIVTNSELEALLLEDTLIKKYQPKYNIELKDNKHYPFIMIDFSKDYPRLEIVRIKKNQKNVQYFGPYSGKITKTVQLFNRLFPLVKCKNFKRQQGCLYKDINKCLAPCLFDNNVTKSRYQKILKEVVLCLKGSEDKLILKWQKKMYQYSKKMQYEKAAIYRDQLSMISKLLEPQIVVSQKGTFDLWVAEYNEKFLVFYLFKVRQGRLSGDFHQKIKMDQLISMEDTLERALLVYYQNNPDIPTKIYLPWVNKTIQQLLSNSKLQKIRQDSLTQLARTNALLLISDEKNIILKRIKEILGLATIPRRIECYDISTTMGKDTVASRVVFIDGNPAKEFYRHYIIQSVQDKPDDFASMNEVLTRRIQGKNEKEEALPDLFILDGGKGQLSIGLKVLKKFNIKIDMISLAEREETIILSDLSELKLPLDSQEMKMIIRLRNEAHRFAVSFHRKQRSKSFKKSKLDSIPGLGEAKKIRLLKTFGSLDNIRKAGDDQLQKIVGKKLTQIIKEQLK